MKIKVLHMIHSLVGGGAEKQLRLLANGMNTEIFDVTVFCVNDAGHDIDSQSVNITVANEKSPYKLSYLREIWRVIRDNKPDIVHIWLPASVSIPAMLFAFIQGRKIIFSYRNRMTFNRGLCYPEFLIALICADTIISNHEVIDSNFLYKWLYKLKHGRVIRNAVYVPDNYQKTSLAKVATNKFIFIGRLTKQKNPLILIDAFAALKGRAGWCLEVYGKGELEGAINNLIAIHGLNDKIFMKGFTPDPYLVMQAADCLIFPSLHEGMPNVLVEAFNIGLPVIASNITENINLVNDNESVIWVNPCEVQSISNGVTSFLAMDVESRQKLVINAKKISSEYAIEKMVLSYQYFYKSMSEKL